MSREASLTGSTESNTSLSTPSIVSLSDIRHELQSQLKKLMQSLESAEKEIDDKVIGMRTAVDKLENELNEAEDQPVSP